MYLIPGSYANGSKSPQASFDSVFFVADDCAGLEGVITPPICGGLGNMIAPPVYGCDIDENVGLAVGAKAGALGIVG